MLLVDQDPASLGIGDDATEAEVVAALRRVAGGRVARPRIFVLRRQPRVLAILLEVEPAVHPADDLTLAEIVDTLGGLTLARGRPSLPVSPRRDGERVERYADLVPAGARASTHHAGPRRIVFHFSKIQVGLGDRLVGLASVMVLARALGAEVHLERPVLPGLFETRWTETHRPPRYDFDFLDTRYRYYELLRRSDFGHLGAEVHAIGNECFHYSLYDNPHVQGRLSTFDQDLRDAYRSIFTEVLRPLPVVRGSVAEVVARAAGRELVGVQLRTGLIPGEFPWYSPRDVQRYCGRIADALPGPPERYMAFVTADDNALAEEARRRLAERGIASTAVDAPVLHISYDRHRDSGDARLKLITDLFVLARAEHLFFSLHSNFGRVACMLGEPRRAFGLFGRGFDLVRMPDLYAASSKHLFYNDAALSALGGMLRFRYYEEGAAERARLLLGACLRFPAGFLRSWVRTRSVPVRLAPRIFMESLFASE